MVVSWGVVYGYEVKLLLLLVFLCDGGVVEWLVIFDGLWLIGYFLVCDILVECWVDMLVVCDWLVDCLKRVVV